MLPDGGDLVVQPAVFRFEVLKKMFVGGDSLLEANGNIGRFFQTRIPCPKHDAHLLIVLLVMQVNRVCSLAWMIRRIEEPPSRFVIRSVQQDCRMLS